ncbi:aminomethyl-transferring glycine dehydrogenase [Candidatus Neomicrothrix sp.]|uniref:aminomethyl-transferring glycine dehydrogenase n=1 Tax=Candidatus Neomicrothrix sp. TaxID=2719034 RepID=UPI001B46C075|nr:aminomethyl-transferring glycine dehydrogenase [Candidatus Microthrix sp.]MBK6502696.1 aminomethyl-transferring glycine dehydrogenase [Candidatus Microthrix sp.]MBK7021803.1 aminomethyl-transferring glycine dehydrogenase [Candidatus Microthrix sp.]MBK7323237.1 aminomethyl-transferring glycine dehydrogenase [Candidatus Microthrix sp.]MBP6133921.1 aminomethyl-transferring glycine dehydrogenase [Candidatus Microthrix sp.]MBP6148804.1 aminomethyl-transferring glycine dehydrogenase [Candidatus M
MTHSPVTPSVANPSAAPIGSFAGRHLGSDSEETVAMLADLGFDSMEELIATTVPASVRDTEPLTLTGLPVAMSEPEVVAHMRSLAAKNRVVTSMIGQGYYGTHTPAVIQRNVLENPAWYTAYTPYQPEISQGRLEVLLNFQTMVQDLTGLEMAGASLLDEATAAAEALTLCRRQSKSRAERFLVDSRCHPQVIAVVATRAEPLGIELDLIDPRTSEVNAADYFGALLAYPATDGTITDFAALTAALHEVGAVVAATTDLLACTMLTPPGEWGADIAVGSAQRFGVPMGAGGPHAGFMAVTDKLRRSLPGRLVGVSIDAAGRPALRLALQTREQHIRREKATSNICTAQVLLAVMAASYATYHGPEGLLAIAGRVAALTKTTADSLRNAGVEVATTEAFDTLWASVPGRADAVVAAALSDEINLRRIDADTVGLSVDETTSPAALALALAAIAGVNEASAVEVLKAAVAGAGANTTGLIPAGLVRTTPFLTHPTFHSHRTETEMLRYLRRLADADLALDRSMIPLGSCTMKLNATTEMLPVTWPEFAELHPFAPADQLEGITELARNLEQWLVDICGYDAASIQPNAGSQGELAGLMAIRAYHQSRGDSARHVCLIPESAHGTNAASAVMAGMKVIVVGCDDEGNVDLDDLNAKVVEHASDLAALMITYPSTHGVFEEAISEICGAVHDAGGQVYLDGANLNAMVGLARPGRFGADVSHLNLHKTFCIPHGGGGPGVGPVVMREHLAPFRPATDQATNPAGETQRADRVGAISAAPLGSASILPISYAYIAMMGADGLTAASEGAILTANYVAKRLGDYFPVLYTGARGQVAHECILDLRPLTKASGITNEDVAKRLIDYGFHAPTMSFPVSGTLMVEPTESESKAELDRFCDAMVAIHAEIDQVVTGAWPADDNPLVNAPHPSEDLLVDEWTHPYSRELAAYPLPELRRNKYWVPVSRIDGGYGDRNLVCSCPPIEVLAEA